MGGLCTMQTVISHASILSFLFSITAIAQDVQCYFPNGTALPGTDYFATIKPCAFDPVRTICCATNRGNPAGGDTKLGGTADECLPNGLCQNRSVQNGKNVTSFWANFCTEKDIAGGNCLDICQNTRNAKGVSQVTSCDGTNTSDRWCCGNGDACCADGVDAVELPKEFVGRAVSSSTASIATSISTLASTASGSPMTSGLPSTLASPSSSSSSEAAQPQPQNNSLSTGAKAGIGIGAGLGATALLGAFIFVRKAYAWRRDASRSKSAEEAQSPYAEIGDQPLEKYHGAGFAPSELPSTADSPVELPPPPPSELAGSEAVKERYLSMGDRQRA